VIFRTPEFFRFSGALLLVVAAVPLGLHEWGFAVALLIVAASLFAVASVKARRLRGSGSRRW
jgi:VIT1/CCC1 family predicted Fe2+/Mn2+ transporter